MKKIEKMTYTEIVNYCKKLKLEARYRIAQETLDFFKQNVNKPMTFKELIAIVNNLKIEIDVIKN